MDVVMLSRLQFAMAACFHFLFVPLTLGLSLLVAVMETWFVRTGQEMYRRMARFWGKLFLINFALGVVTGITLEFQFGTNWSRYSIYVGDVFGSLLAVEATLAFFLESTFIAVWMFGWNRLSPRVHALAIWIVAVAANFSAFWILAANAWMQHPVGYVMRNGRAELESFTALITHGFAWSQFIHTLSASYVLAGFFVMGVSAYHLLGQREVPFFKRSFGMAAVFALVASVVAIGHGHVHGGEVARIQPTKLAAMEAMWDTQSCAPQHLIVVPDPANEKNSIEFLEIPCGLSVLAFHSASAEVRGLKAFHPDLRPPVIPTFLAFRAMVGLGFLFPVLAGLAVLLLGSIERRRWLLWLLCGAIPLPYIAIQAGWIVAEVGRQPWIVYGMLKTSDAASPLAGSQVALSCIAFFLLYSFLALLDAFLLFKVSRAGPRPEQPSGPVAAKGGAL